MFNLQIDNLLVTFYGSSHNQYLGIIIDGLSPGISFDFTLIDEALKRRRSSIEINTPRKEIDNYKILSGYFNGQTDGSPLHIMLENNDVVSSDYKQTIMRPNHADYANYIKYNGNNDYRGGGVFSGRMTVLYVICGFLIKQLLEELVEVKAYIKQYKDLVYTQPDFMQQLIRTVKADYMNNVAYATKLGVNITGLAPGLGAPLFNSVESVISSYMFAIPAVKAISFGKINEMMNDFYSDELQYVNEKVVVQSVHGGINGGITISDIDFELLIKPVYSNIVNLKTVDIANQTNILTSNDGRHDLFIANRILVVVEAMGYLSLYSLKARRI